MLVLAQVWPGFVFISVDAVVQLNFNLFDYLSLCSSKKVSSDPTSCMVGEGTMPAACVKLKLGFQKMPSFKERCGRSDHTYSRSNSCYMDVIDNLHLSIITGC